MRYVGRLACWAIVVSIAFVISRISDMDPAWYVFAMLLWKDLQEIYKED